MCMRRNTWSKSPAQRASSSGRQSQFWQRPRDVLGSLVDREIWLRACAIAALRERASATPLEAVDALALLRDCGVYAGCDAVRSANGGEDDERSNLAPASSASGSRAALAVGTHRTRRSLALSEQTSQEIGTGLDRSKLCANSCMARPRRVQQSVMRSACAITRRLKHRGYLLAARWIVATARVLAARGLLSAKAALLAVRWSSRLSKKSWAIWRSERPSARAKFE
jgi:hypothetical protein